MAKNSVRTPQGMAGLQRFSDDESGKFHIPPQFVIVLAIIVVIIVVFLHLYGNAIFGVPTN